VAVAVHGLEPLEGDTAFAFMVLRLRSAVARSGLLELLRYIAPLVPDAEAFMEEFPDELDGPLRIIGVPWAPAEAGMAVDVQRRLIDGAHSVGVEVAWFFQTGTSLPTVGDDPEPDDDDDDEVEGDDDEGTRVVVLRAPTSTGETYALAAVSGEIGGERGDPQLRTIDDEPEHEDEDTGVIELEPDVRHDDADAGDDDGDDHTWSHGPPPSTRSVRFPVDAYPEIIEDLDREDFGIAFKLAGPYVEGEHTVLLAFHTLWLAPYAGRYRNTAVTIDTVHHSAHLWVDRFAVPCEPAELVHHLLWIVSKLDEVVPVLHARFAPATMAQKCRGLDDEDLLAQPFVLGGNPLVEIYRAGGEAAVDGWLAEQTDWSADELALMLRELAVEIVSTDEGDEAELAQPAPGDALDAHADAAPAEGDHDDADEPRDDGEPDLDDPDDTDRGRHLAREAAALLKARCLAGKLDSRVGDALLARVRRPDPPRAVIEILGAVRHRAAVPALIEILEHSIDDGLVAAAARALGAIGDASAVAVLSDVAAAHGAFIAKPAAAAALAACIASARETRVLDDADLTEVLAAIVETGEGQLDPVTWFACGRIARHLPPHRRAETRRRFADLATPDDDLGMLARGVAYQLASSAVPPPAPPPELRNLLERCLVAYDGTASVVAERWKLALEIAVTMPELVDLQTVVPLTRVLDPEVRAAAHAVLARLGHPAPVAPIFDATAAHRLDDGELARRLDVVHLVGRDALVTEVGRRKLPAARPALVAACHTAIGAARPGERMFEHDRRLLVAALPILARTPDSEAGGVVERMAQHPNATLQRLAKKWYHLRHDDQEIN
jgi:hypothetical protein